VRIDYDDTGIATLQFVQERLLVCYFSAKAFGLAGDALIYLGPSLAAAADSHPMPLPLAGNGMFPLLRQGVEDPGDAGDEWFTG
jgi:hypothetical protein